MAALEKSCQIAAGRNCDKCKTSLSLKPEFCDKETNMGNGQGTKAGSDIRVVPSVNSGGAPLSTEKLKIFQQSAGDGMPEGEQEDEEDLMLPFVGRPSFTKDSLVFEIKDDEVRVTDCRSTSSPKATSKSPRGRSVSFAEGPEIFQFDDCLYDYTASVDGYSYDDPFVAEDYTTTALQHQSALEEVPEDMLAQCDVSGGSIQSSKSLMDEMVECCDQFLKGVELSSLDVSAQTALAETDVAQERCSLSVVEEAVQERTRVSEPVSQTLSTDLMPTSSPDQKMASAQDVSLTVTERLEESILTQGTTDEMSNLTNSFSSVSASSELESSTAQDSFVRARANTLPATLPSKIRASFRLGRYGSLSRSSSRRSARRPRSATVTSLLDDQDCFHPEAKPPSAFRLQRNRLSDTDATLLGYRMAMRAPEFFSIGAGIEAGALCTEVLPNLYVANMAGVCNAVNLVKRRIRFLVNLTGAVAPNLPIYLQEFSCAALDDCISAQNKSNLRPYLKQCSDVVSLCLETTYGVIVYSQTGVCSAPAVVMDYLLRHKQMTWQEAEDLLLRKHPPTELRQPFVEHLQALAVEMQQSRDEAAHVTDLFLKRSLKGVAFLV